jgi:hypothetical protein
MPIYQVIVKGRWSDSLDETRNIFTVDADGTGVLAQLTDWATDLWVNGTEPLQNVISTTWGMYSVEIKIRNAGVWQSVAETPVVVEGLYNAQPMPHLIAACVTGLTIGRPRPKKYIAGLCEPHNLAGAIVEGALTNLATFAQNWTTPVSSGGVTIEAVSFHEATEGPAKTIVGYRVSNLFSTQRRRKQGRGI